MGNRSRPECETINGCPCHNYWQYLQGQVALSPSLKVLRDVFCLFVVYVSVKNSPAAAINTASAIACYWHERTTWNCKPKLMQFCCKYNILLL